jgi:proline iminopeptidase
MDTGLPQPRSGARESWLSVGGARLYCREIGEGPPVIVLHGGPDFDHSYLVPELDTLSESLRLIYYDQRGRGRSAENVRPEDVSIESEIADLEAVRQGFGLESVAVLGHSWGGLLAMEYAVRHPKRVSHLILLNSAPGSHRDLLRMRSDRLKNAPADVEALKALAATSAYESGSLEAEQAYYRVHFRATLRSPAHLERILERLRAHFTPESVLKARAIEQRLYDETWQLDHYDVIAKLTRLTVPALVVHSQFDLIPVACAARIAGAIPGARFVVLGDCGHFSYLERPAEVRREVLGLFQK